MRRQALVRARRARRNAVSKEIVSKYTKTCHKKYPKVTKKAGATILSALTFGGHGLTRKKRRNDCLAAARKGKPDPRAKDAKKVMSQPYKLWAMKEPWKSRPKDVGGNVARFLGLKTGGDALRSVARGRKPWGNKYIDLERKATILGGLTTLQALGVVPWATLAFGGIRLKLSQDPHAKKLLSLVQQAAKQEGSKRPATLREASELVRARVIEEEAGGPAWAARGLHLSLAGTKATGKRAEVEGITSTAVMNTAQVLNGTGVGAIVGAPLTVIGLGLRGMQGRTKVEQTRSALAAQEFSQKFQNMLTVVKMKAELEALQEHAAQLTEQEERDAAIAGQRLARGITLLVGLSVVGGASYLTYRAAQKYRSR